MKTDEKTSRKDRGGLEFIPLPEGHTEADFRIPKGRRHPGQGSLFEGTAKTFAQYRRDQMGEGKG